MRKRKFVNTNDIVLVSLRDFQDNTCDIIDCYDDNGARKLMETKELPESFNIDGENQFQDEFDNIEFTTDIPSNSSDDDESNSGDDESNGDDINLEEI